MKLPFKSVRWRLLFWHSLLSVFLVLALCLLAYKLVSREQYDRIDSDMVKYERNFFRGVFSGHTGEKNIGPPNAELIRTTLRGLNNKESISSQIQALLDGDGDEYFILVWEEDGSVLFKSEHTPSGLAKSDYKANENSHVVVEKGKFRMRIKQHSSGGTTLVGKDISGELASLQQFRVILAVGGTAILAVAILGSGWLAGRALKPIETISQTASRIADGNLRERISISGNGSELGQLGHVLNDTFDRLASAIERQKNFTSDASHELKTPLTIILSESQRGMKYERSAEEYREILGNCSIAAKRMRNIIEALLLLARQDQNESEETAPMNLADIVSDVVDLIRVEAASSSHTIVADLVSTTVSANRELMEVLLRNLISNAISHTPAGTEVTVRTCIEDSEAILEIHDNGPGIAAEHLPHLFDRFYRVDEARTQSSGHSGLGLAIAKTIVEGHRGVIEATSTPGKGTTFTVKLALHQI